MALLNNADAIYFGDRSVDRVYLGTRRVWPSWLPADLFADGEQGVWYDPSDLTTMFQDAGGTIPVTGVEQPVGLILDKSGNGNHASQVTATARPMLNHDANGKLYLDFDGVDDQLVGMIPMALRPGMLLAAAQNRYDRNSNLRTIGVVADSNINDYVFWVVTNAQREHFYARGSSQGLDQVSTITGTDASPLNTPSVGDVVVPAAPDPLRAYTNGIAHPSSSPSNWPSGLALGSVANLTFPLAPTVKLGVYGVVVCEGPVSVKSQADTRNFLSRSIGASA